MAATMTQTQLIASIAESCDMPTKTARLLAAAAARAVSKTTTSSSVQVVRQGTDLVVSIIRAGAVDGYQKIEYLIDQAGNKQVIQSAFNNVGLLVHYDPK